MRESLYFKDDDVRMSLLAGNYVTLTNLSGGEIERLIKMKVSPVNISVHATAPELRVAMLRSKNAGACLEIMRGFAAAGISMNCQIVVCPGVNDGEVLRNTLSDLVALRPHVNSVSVVPVGLTVHRAGLYPLRPVGKAEAEEILDLCAEFAGLGVYPADELYIKANRPIPPEDFYGGFPQLENGVGMVALLQSEFSDALAELPAGLPAPPPFSLATGIAAEKFIKNLVDELRLKCDNLNCSVYAIENRFFGESVTVAGLVTGGDLIGQLRGRQLGGRLLIPRSMLRHEGDLFLDGVTPAQVEEQLGVRLVPVENDGEALLNALLNI